MIKINKNLFTELSKKVFSAYWIWLFLFTNKTIKI
tara:strand:+ start:317 stop:421 length:105 start_codon:yes stop_codon:yes gene_type:complete